MLVKSSQIGQQRLTFQLTVSKTKNVHLWGDLCLASSYVNKWVPRVLPKPNGEGWPRKGGDVLTLTVFWEHGPQ